MTISPTGYFLFADDAPVEFSGDRVLHELHFAHGDTQEQEQYITKTILRSGTWLFTPGPSGVKRKPLKIVRDGKSDPANGKISLSELVENFKAQAVPYVTIPLSDNEQDHNNAPRNNTGFVRDLWIEDGPDGIARLKAKMDFTEPEVREKVLRGTIPDVSCGIPFGITRKEDGKTFGAVLEHVCLTHRPFVHGLEPFGIAASDGEATTVEVLTEAPEAEATAEVLEAQPQPVSMSARETEAALEKALGEQLGLAEGYSVIDFRNGEALVHHAESKKTWAVPFEITSDEDHPVQLVTIDKWTLKDEGLPTPPAPTPPAQPVAPSVTPRQLSELDRARQLRELRLSQPSGNETGGTPMTVKSTGVEALDGLELSDEARAAIQNVLNENASLKARTREAEVDAKIDELKSAGFENRPGFLKLYRQVALSDDGGPAAVLLSEDGKNESNVSAREILDRAIDAIKGSEGKVEFSDQALASGNDNKPPADADGENQMPVEERLAAVKTELGIK